MTPRPLSDRELAAGLRVHLPPAHAGLHARIVDQIALTPQVPRRPWIIGWLTDGDPTARRRAMLLVALGALALSIVVAAAAGALLRVDRPSELAVVPPADPTSSPPDGTPAPSDDVIIRGWPGTFRNPAGTYSWGGLCASASCVKGFMHNGYGSGDIDFRIRAGSRNPAPDDSWKPATVAGLPGWYRRSGEWAEEWLVNVEDSGVVIRMEVQPDTSPADLAEAYAIVRSMRTIPKDDDLGFRLVFTLTTGDWDSG